ncbi:MAG: thioredoxin domain-containing protein [Desulfarculus sp.]|nr:thioredoxin domain-containing protein [Desulfarculus sp.]
MPNRLAGEQSPYLLQHAHNPVDWYPWGQEALAKARQEDKPIFLSIGYATCHWCHVMAHESFEDTLVAAALNRDFVSIKVDREERPDLDGVYMGVCQALTGAGGWPLSLFLTPEAKPFYAGTYFPPRTMMGRPGFLELLGEVARLWRQDRQRLLSTSEEITKAVQPKPSQPGADPGLATLEKGFWQLVHSFDAKRGGFGQAPKFPTPHRLNFLLRWHLREPQSRAWEMVETTLKAMRAGGIYDHLGQGFARYAVDENWLVPHFEKMLYDQALLAYAYLEAFQAGGGEEFAQTSRDIFAYVLRDMTDPSGGFYSAEDADSEGVEGLFYVWTPQQVHEVLGAELGELFCRYYDITPGGNFEHGRSIIHQRASVEDFARNLGLDPDKLARDLAQARQRLWEAREKRVRPLKDDKVLTAWNGLMIAALAKGHQVLGDEAHLAAARGAARFVLAQLSDPEGRLLRRWRGGQAGGQGFLEDYAFFVWGLIELHQADLDPAWLGQAARLCELACRLFEDELHGGFFFTPHDGEGLIAREKESYDGATPSGNSVMAVNLLRLARLTGQERWERKALKLLRAFGETLRRQPMAHTHMLLALDLALGPSQELVLAGGPDDQALQEMLSLARAGFAPRRSLLLVPPGQAGEPVRELAPFTRGMGTLEGRPAAYLCSGQACQRPISDPAELKAALHA